MGFFDFFKKKTGNKPENANVPTGCQPGNTNIPTDDQPKKAAPNTQLNRLMNQLYQQSQERARASSAPAGKPKRERQKVESDSKVIPNIEAMFDMEGHRVPDIDHNKAYGFENEDFALSIPRPKADLKKARKLFEMGTKDKTRTSQDADKGQWAQNCHLLFCSYMFGYEPALKEYQKQRDRCRASYRQMCGKTDDYLLLADLRHPARRFALSSALNSEHFNKVWDILLNSSYGKTLEEAWNDLAAAMRLYKIPGPKHDFAFYAHSYPINLDSDIENIWAGISKDLWEYVDRVCPIDDDAIDKIVDDYEHDMMVYNVLSAFTLALNALNAMYDKVFEAVWENPLNLYYNFGEL